MAKDVCLCLGLRLGASGVSNHMKKVGEDERRVLGKTSPLLTRQMRDFRFEGRENWLTFTIESGLYKLIMRSDKAAARPFQDWVTKEVLPAIRRTRGGRVWPRVDSGASGLNRGAFGCLSAVMGVMQS